MEICNWLCFSSHEDTEPQQAKSSGPGWDVPAALDFLSGSGNGKATGLPGEGICEPSIQAGSACSKIAPPEGKISIIDKDKRLPRERMAVPFPLHFKLKA